MPNIAAEIFKAYDIRGIVEKQLNAEVAYLLGQAIGSEALQRKQNALVIGYDGRDSSAPLAQALSNGLLAVGINVIDIGRVTTPMVYFAAHHLETMSAVMVTGSHNPPSYNGFKIMLGGNSLADEAIQKLRARIEVGEWSLRPGQYQQQNIQEAYFLRISSDIQLLRRMNIIVDAGNGVAGPVAPLLYRRFGCRVRELYCNVDGQFPNHHPDPAKPQNLQDLIHALSKTDAELGLAFDGDGDRLGVVTKSGDIIYPDRLLMLFAADVLSRNPGAKIIYDIKSTRLLDTWIKEHKGRPQLVRTGHSYMKAKMKEANTLLGGELSGHIFFNERWYGFDDGIYAGARLLEILSQSDNPTDVLNALPCTYSTPEINIAVTEGQAHALVEKIREQGKFGDAKIINIDGIRAEYSDGFGLIRASNTNPVLVLRFEGDTPKALKRIQSLFRKIVAKVISGELPF